MMCQHSKLEGELAGIAQLQSASAEKAFPEDWER